MAVDTSGTEVTVDGNEKLTLRKTGVTGADGYLRIGGLLLDHVYLLKETTPLNGYTILSIRMDDILYLRVSPDIYLIAAKFRYLEKMFIHTTLWSTMTGYLQSLRLK